MNSVENSPLLVPSPAVAQEAGEGVAGDHSSMQLLVLELTDFFPLLIF